MKEQILSHLPAEHPWREHLQYFTSIDSTNTRAKELARENAPHGTVLIADSQTGGRGRRGRSFHSPAGSGIYMSVLIRPECPPFQLMHLTCASATAACNALEGCISLRPGIKWTNDLVWGKRKLAGILTELVLSPDGKVDAAIIGIGINCCQQENQFPEEIRGIAGSLASVAGREIDRAAVAAALIQEFAHMSQVLLTQKDALLNSYRKDCVTLGQQISLVRGEEVRHGTALDIDGEGALIVRFEDDTVHAVNSGEVSIRGMYGYV